MKNFALPTLLFTLSCTQPIPLSESEKGQVTSEVIDMFDNYHADIKAGGLTAEFAYLDSSADFFWVPPGYKAALSYDSVKTILEGNALLFQEVDFRWDTLQVFPLSNEIATYTGIVKGEMTDTTGVVAKMRLIESGTLIKREGDWKLLSGQSAVLE